MAHPDHDRIIGRLAGARLRGAAGPALSAAAPAVHPDPEAWAAYLDGGLRADEVARLETHLAGCPVCRRFLAVLAPEVSSGGEAAVRELEAPAAQRGVVLPFPRRRVFAWMAAAAAILMAVTLWSVSRLGDLPASRVAMSTAPAEPPSPLTAPPASSPAPSPSAANEPRSRLEDSAVVDRVAGQAPAVAVRSDAPAPRQPAGFAAAEEQQTAPAANAPAGGGRNIQQQSNTVAAGGRARGPLATQQANQQAGTQQQYAQAARQAQPPASAPVQSRPNTPPPPAATAAQGAAPAVPPAQLDLSADTREQRANEQLAESVAITSSTVGARRASTRPELERSRAAAADRDEKALSKDEAKRAVAFGSVAVLPSFAEPGGRLRWRIADGQRLESSSDGGATWTGQYTARGERLRAGAAPAIDSAWAVGDRGLVLRFVVPGGWTPVSRPAAATLIAVSATGAETARVIADDGRVFETADGGATWTPAAPGTGPR
jgi:hypothetical protein